MYPDVEDITEAVRQAFINQFPDYLAKVDARKATPLSPLVPEEYRFGETDNEPNMPALLFLSDDASEQQDEYEWRREAYHLAIEAYYTDQDITNLQRIMRRYAAAIDDTLRANQRLDGLSQTITKLEPHFTGTGTSKKTGGLLQGVRVDFDVILITD